MAYWKKTKYKLSGKAPALVFAAPTCQLEALVLNQKSCSLCKFYIRYFYLALDSELSFTYFCFHLKMNFSCLCVVGFFF